MRETATANQHGKKLSELRLQKGYAGTARWPIKFFRLVVRGLFRLFFRIRVIGLRDVPHTPVIVCANHLGWADPFLVLLFFPVEPRIYALGLHPGHVSAFRTRVVDALQIMVAVDPGRPRQALEAAEDVLKRGGSLLVFPEGTAVGTREGTLLELQHGASHISQATGIPILPVGITGTSELWVGRRLTIRIGKPIEPTQFQGDTRTRTHAMTTRLGEELRGLLPGDKQQAKLKPLRQWLTKLFY